MESNNKNEGSNGKNLKEKENIANSFSEYACVNNFLEDERTCAMIKTLGIDSYSVNKIIENYAGHLQVPTEWKPYKPLEEHKRARESASMVEFFFEPIQDNIKKKCREEEHIRRRSKKPKRTPKLQMQILLYLRILWRQALWKMK